MKFPALFSSSSISKLCALSLSALALCGATAAVAQQAAVEISPAATITEFQISGAGTNAYQGTFVNAVNPSSTTTGLYIDSANVFHGYTRTSSGKVTKFNVRQAGTASGQGTIGVGINKNGNV